MKKLFSILSVILVILNFCSCDKSTNSDSQDANTLNGNAVDYVKAGDSLTSSSVYVSGTWYNIGSSMKVLKYEGNIATIKVNADLTQVPGLAAFNNFIPTSMKNNSGKIDTEIKLKLTSEGIADFFNKDNAQHTLVKYNDNEGSEYNLTKSNGVTIHRKVTTKSTTDDFPYGLWNIKVMTIEQDSRVPGIKKFIYKANHKFGLVYFEIVADDGSSAYVYF
jgi:hypothetical protein